MTHVLRTVRVAAVQATPVVLDAEACVDKAVALLGEAAEAGAELAVLPETFVPLYPSNAWARDAAAFGGWDELWERLWANSVEVPGPLVDRLVAARRRHAIPRAVGGDERGLAPPRAPLNTPLVLGAHRPPPPPPHPLPPPPQRLVHPG